MPSTPRHTSGFRGSGSVCDPEYLPVHPLSVPIGQVIALFIVGLGEYGVVWLGTDWDKEVLKGIRRNKEDAKRREEFLRAEAEPDGHGAHIQ